MPCDDDASRVGGTRAIGTPGSVMIIREPPASSVLRLSPQKFGKFDPGPETRTAVVGKCRGQVRACAPYLPLSVTSEEIEISHQRAFRCQYLVTNLIGEGSCDPTEPLPGDPSRLMETSCRSGEGVGELAPDRTTCGDGKKTAPQFEGEVTVSLHTTCQHQRILSGGPPSVVSVGTGARQGLVSSTSRIEIGEGGGEDLGLGVPVRGVPRG